MRVDERDELLRASIAEDQGVDSPRYAVRTTSEGLEWFVARAHSVGADEVEYHGHPVSYVPPRVLRRFRDQGAITERDYRRLIRQLG